MSFSIPSNMIGLPGPSSLAPSDTLFNLSLNHEYWEPGHGWGRVYGSQTWQPLGSLPFLSPQDLTDEFGQAIATNLNTWLQGHPLMAWMVHHPLISLGLVVLGLLLIWSLLQAVVELTQDFWVWLLQVPLRLGRWMLKGLFWAVVWAVGFLGFSVPLLGRSPSPSPSSSSELKSEPEPESESLSSPPLTLTAATAPESLATAEIISLLQRLEQLGQEQNQILHQITRLAEMNHHQQTQLQGLELTRNSR